MPSRVLYQAPPGWFRKALRTLRIPFVFLLSSLASFCAFRGNALVGDGHRSGVRLVLWDADLMPHGERLSVRQKTSGAFADAVDPDVLVIYDVPSFDQLLKLRDALGLYGYTAVMSNYFCGRTPAGLRWPLEMAILSRYPISQATQFDPPSLVHTACAKEGLHISGPVVAGHAPLALPAHRSWPMRANAGAAIGPGLLSVRIDAIGTSVVALRVPHRADDPKLGRRARQQMRATLAGAAGLWMAKQKARYKNDHVFAAGDFGRDDETADQPPPADRSIADAIDGVIRNGGRDGTHNAGTPVSLTHSLFAQGAAPGIFPHSDRIYLWTDGVEGFGPAQRVKNSFGSRAFPLIVRDSGVACARNGSAGWPDAPAFAALSRQVFAGAQAAFDKQAKAAGAGAPWVVSIALDNALLDATPLRNRLALACKAPEPADWAQWLKRGQAKLLPGAGALMADLREAAANGKGRIIVFTSLPRAAHDDLVANLARLGVAPAAAEGVKDGAVQIHFATTRSERDHALRAATDDGARLLVAIASTVNGLPQDPAIAVGGAPQSCSAAGDGADPARARRARFGRCYFLLPRYLP